MPAGRRQKTRFLKVLFCPSAALGPVTINGHVVAEGEDIAQTGILVVNSGDYAVDSIRLVVDGTVWIPTERSELSVSYIVQSIGEFVVYSGSKVVMSFRNSVAADFPSWMNGHVEARISATTSDSDSGLISSLQSSDNFYLNYSVAVNSDYPYYVVFLRKDDTADLTDFVVEGGEIVSLKQFAQNVVVRIHPLTIESQVWLKLGELILFVAPV